MIERRSTARLTPARRRLLDRELDRLLELDERARQAALSQLQRSHPRIASWLVRLLQAMGQTDQHLAEPLARLAEHWAAESGAERHRPAADALEALALPRGTLLGAWRVIEPVGAGGMGVVYRVERADGAFEMTAAAKLIRIRLNAQLAFRLALERQLLARLDHPNIARILDGGATDDDQPYLILEWVPGADLTECGQALSVEKALDLWTDLAAAVAHAHQRSIVHGDIKPANVRVGSDDRVRLLDFGVASLVLEDGAAQDDDARALTPAFAAPEQFRGEPISTQSDVWALGALLAWLLLGPNYQRSLLRSPETLDRALKPELPQASDLSAVIARACAERPADRYAGVPEFIEDLQRYRQCRPVKARPATRGYVLDRFVRRHPLPVALGALALVFLLVGLGGVSWQAHVAGIERDRAEAQRDRAEIQAATTERVSEFVVGLFEQADPYLSAGGELSARDLLEQGRARISVLDEAPRVQAEMYQVLARVHRSLAEHASAHALSLRAIELLEAHPQADGDRLAQAWSLHAGTLASLGRYTEAEAAHRRALQLTDPHDALAVAAGLNNLGLAVFSLGRMAEAEALLETALALRQSIAPTAAETAASYNNLAVVLAAQDRRDEAEPKYRRALEIRRQTLGENHATTTYSLTNLATLHAQLGRWAEAEAGYREALSLRRSIFGDGHPAVASVLYQIGWLQAQRGEYLAASEHLEQALGIREQVLGRDHPSTAVVLNAAAGVARELGDIERAKAWLERALAIYRETYGQSHHDIALVLSNLGLTHKRAGDWAVAEGLLQDALDMNRRELGWQHRHVADNHHRLARLYLELNQRELAAEHARIALSTLLELGQLPEHPDLEALRRLLVKLELADSPPEA
ncbi:MAG: tetratricopeptide repeat protein [Wenzhouxiangella sp.]